jgi:hypothetical protein
MIRVVGIHTSTMDLQRDRPHIFQHIVDLLKMVYQCSLTILHQISNIFPIFFYQTILYFTLIILV